MRVVLVLAAIIASLIIAVVAFSFLSTTFFTDRTPKIAIVDQLSVQWPDPTFNQTIQGILNQTSLKVDYYPSEDVTVEFYRTLPSHNYKLIIFRVHSTAESVVQNAPQWVVFFTSESYSNTTHVQMQMNMQLAWVRFPNSEPKYFGITPLFVKDAVEGRFSDTVIISMGCEGLKQNTMADAFIQKGAKAFISWNGFVSESHTDNATAYLLRHLITEKQTIGEAVNQTMNDVGPDPTDKSILMYYPDNAGSNLLLANATMATPTARTTGKNTNKNDENSGITLVPTILTS
jgi:hypothetical protein